MEGRAGEEQVVQKAEVVFCACTQTMSAAPSLCRSRRKPAALKVDLETFSLSLSPRSGPALGLSNRWNPGKINSYSSSYWESTEGATRPPMTPRERSIVSSTPPPGPLSSTRRMPPPTPALPSPPVSPDPTLLPTPSVSAFAASLPTQAANRGGGNEKKVAAQEEEADVYRNFLLLIVPE